MTASTDIRQHAISLLETLPSDKLTQAVELLESLSQSPQSNPTGAIGTNMLNYIPLMKGSGKNLLQPVAQQDIGRPVAGMLKLGIGKER
jgi:hypothetical protein